MRAFLLAALLASVASAASSPHTITLPGHGAGSFGSPNDPIGALAGGVAWRSDQEVYTLDTTRVLKRWSVASGALLATQTLSPLAAVLGGTLTLEDRAPDGGLLLQGQGYRGAKPVGLRARLNLQTGKAQPEAACTASAVTLNRCTPDGQTRAWVQGGALRVQGRGTGRTWTLPKGLKPAVLGLSPDGRRAALLVLTPVADWGDHGRGTLYIWNDLSRSAAPQRLDLKAPLLLPGGTLRPAGQGWLLAATVYNTGDRTSGGGAREGQWLALFDLAGRVAWQVPATVGLRGAWPSPDGRRFVTLRGGSVPEVRRTADGTLLRGLGEAVQAAVPLARGHALVALHGGGGAGRLALVDRSGVRTLAPVRAAVLAATPTGTLFASAQGRLVRLHGARGEVKGSWNAAGEVAALAFSPDSQVLSAWVSTRTGTLVQAWTLAGKPLNLPAGATFPVQSVVFTTADDKNGPEQGYRERLSVLTLSGKVLWQTPWTRGGLSVQPSADGRAAVLSGLDPQATGDPVARRFWRVNTQTGRPGPVLVMKPTTQDPNSGWQLRALNGTGRLALLGEGSGDGCGWGLLGYRLADVQTGRLLPTPARLAQGYNRTGGCGFNVPFLRAAFAPDGHLLIQDGNRLDWWSIPGFSLQAVPTGQDVR
ncbi:hypothetical protein GO986_11665 [Deinococcus sp. HMF7620]|uniref:Uncharacterized protein n=1 Tax=Deinococcus arboris TaxID=2682977 RepID=A0A7C9M6U0_9DEIO|nr:hypothetical protein [Deinococcus arboris]MVN87425.1 hypothetical protein [Deinococcus arboris]